MTRAGSFDRLLARHMPKPLRPLAYRLLYPRLMPGYAFDPHVLDGRRVLIAGPARTIESDLAALDPAGFDLVIRMNNGLDTPIAALGPNPYRCEVLFHSLTADIRPVTAQNLRRAGVRTLVHRVPKRGVFLRTIALSDRLPPEIDLRATPVSLHDGLARRLDGHSPTTGLICASLALASSARTVAICGFTFFSTCYVAAYDDADDCDEASAGRVRVRGHHAPDREARLLMTLVEQARARGVEVILGSGVQVAAENMLAHAPATGTARGGLRGPSCFAPGAQGYGLAEASGGGGTSPRADSALS